MLSSPWVAGVLLAADTDVVADAELLGALLEAAAPVSSSPPPHAPRRAEASKRAGRTAAARRWIMPRPCLLPATGVSGTTVSFRWRKVPGHDR